MTRQLKMGSIRTTPHTRGFTIVELLIVIVVIGILAALVLNSFAGAQDNARNGKVASDITHLKQAILAARENSGKTLLQITGNGCTRCSCPYAAGNMTVYSTLPKTDGCWVGYYNALSSIGTAGLTNLNEFKAGDPWGSPYMIDENEGEAGGCGKDVLSSVGKSGTTNGNTTINSIALPNVSTACI